MLQGMTAHYLTHSTFPLKAGDPAWFMPRPAASVCCWYRWRRCSGAHVIGTVGTEEKAQRREMPGRTKSSIYTKEDFAPKAQRACTWFTIGVGKATFLPSLDCLRPRGMMVTFGNASGPVPEIAPLLLPRKGSLFLTRPIARALHRESGRIAMARRRRA